MALFGLFKKKTQAAMQEVKRLQNRDFLEAAIGASVLIAASDGDITDDELDSLAAILAANPLFEPFGSEISQIMHNFKTQFAISYRIGRTAAMREIEQVTCNKKEAEDIMDIILTIAEADGEVTAEEAKEIDKIAQMFGLDVVDHL